MFEKARSFSLRVAFQTLRPETTVSIALCNQKCKLRVQAEPPGVNNTQPPHPTTRLIIYKIQRGTLPSLLILGRGGTKTWNVYILIHNFYRDHQLSSEPKAAFLELGNLSSVSRLGTAFSGKDRRAPAELVSAYLVPALTDGFW